MAKIRACPYCDHIGKPLKARWPRKRRPLVLICASCRGPVK